MKEPYQETFREPTELASRAEEVLRKNDMGGWTKAAPNLYPHQWSWDSAVIAIGWAHFDTRRAAQELVTLFDYQWKTGKVPHIVFNSKAPPDSYFPGAEHWAVAAPPDSPDAPLMPALTSGLCQPPVHAVAVRRIWEIARGKAGGGEKISEARSFLGDIYPKLFAWHRYLATTRDPEESGLVTIYHPWESGTDNSPRWNAALDRITVGELSPHPRPDLDGVTDPTQRPTEEKYERYIWLVELIKRVRCEEGEIHASHPFLVKDVLFSAILVWANEALLRIAGVVGAPDEERSNIQGWIERGLRGLERCWDPELGLCLDHDVRANEPLPALTVGGFAPLIAGASPDRLQTLLGVLDSPAFTGNPELRWPLPPSTSPEDSEFHPRRYWRGPAWPVYNWLLWSALIRAGEQERAERLRRASLEQITSEGFGEYFEPFTGELLGSDNQSWTAAVVLDWLAGPRPEAVEDT